MHEINKRPSFECFAKDVQSVIVDVLKWTAHKNIVFEVMRGSDSLVS